MEDKIPVNLTSMTYSILLHVNLSLKKNQNNKKRAFEVQQILESQYILVILNIGTYLFS